MAKKTLFKSLPEQIREQAINLKERDALEIIGEKIVASFEAKGWTVLRSNRGKKASVQNLTTGQIHVIYDMTVSSDWAKFCGVRIDAPSVGQQELGDETEEILSGIVLE